MKKQNVILFPLLRDIKTIPPTIAIIHYLAEKGYQIVLFTYFTDVQFANTNIKVIALNKSPYPISFLKRLFAKITFHLKFYQYYFKYKNEFKAIWLGAWDVTGISRFKGNTKLIYHFHELEEHKFDKCRKSDFVVLPEENRGWITYFQAELHRKPLLLPNIPNYKEFKMEEDIEILELQKQGKIVVLYSGLIDNKKRNLKELVSSFKYLSENIVLVIIPSFVKIGNDLELLKTHVKQLDLNKRILFFDSRIPPKHLDTMATADIGVGFYSPTSLNNVYAAPNRLYEFVNNGTPVILPNFPTFNALAKEFPFGVNIANPDLPKDIAAAIKGIVDHKEIMKQSISKFKEKEGNYDYYANIIEKEIFN